MGCSQLKSIDAIVRYAEDKKKVSSKAPTEAFQALFESDTPIAWAAGPTGTDSKAMDLADRVMEAAAQRSADDLVSAVPSVLKHGTAKFSDSPPQPDARLGSSAELKFSDDDELLGAFSIRGNSDAYLGNAPDHECSYDDELLAASFLNTTHLEFGRDDEILGAFSLRCTLAKANGRMHSEDDFMSDVSTGVSLTI